jgi:thioredoxin 2
MESHSIMVSEYMETGRSNAGRIKKQGINMNPYLLRCSSCGTLNRVPAEKVSERPLCGKCKNRLAFPDRPVFATFSNFDREVLEWPSYVLVEFFDEWCFYCQQIAPELERLAAKRQGQLKIVKVDMKKDPVLALRFDARGAPTFLLFRAGRQLARLDGSPGDVNALEEWILSGMLKRY